MTVWNTYFSGDAKQCANGIQKVDSIGQQQLPLTCEHIWIRAEVATVPSFCCIADDGAVASR